MAKLADVKAAKERKQKKIAAVGGVLLVIVLFVQVPRMLRMMNSGDEAATAAAPSATAPAAGGAAAPIPTTAAPAQEETVATASLISFSRFASKDPFVQQVEDEKGGATAEGSAPAQGEDPAGEDAEVPGDGTGAPASPTAKTSAEIEINGTVETASVGTPFPAATPMFLLASVSAKSVEIKVADGGSFASGAPTLKLTLGKPVTLVNTADGTRFVLLLKEAP
jgi:hypothetical protein